MSINLSIKSVPETLADKLRARAERHHRSLQGELMAIIEAAALEAERPAAAFGTAAPWPAAGTELALERRGGSKTIERLVAERALRPLRPPAGLPRAVDIVRGARDKR